MARSNHGVLTAAERYDRRKGRQGRPTHVTRRTKTRAAQIRLALQEG
jgi:hypothetical protein